MTMFRALLQEINSYKEFVHSNLVGDGRGWSSLPGRFVYYLTISTRQLFNLYIPKIDRLTLTLQGNKAAA